MAQVLCHVICLCVGDYLMRLHHYKPPHLSICISIRVNEQWLSFEPESQAVISLSSNTPTSSNDAKNMPGYACAQAVWRVWKKKKKWNKKDLKKDGCRKRVCLQVDVVFHRWEMRRMMGYFHVAVMCVCVCVAVFHFYFHFKEEWAFNMQLRNCLSVKHSLMSCCFCSLWERAWVSLSTSNESHVERWLDL